MIKLHKDFINPPTEFTQYPFWFWNDRLSDDEIIAQMKDFRDHGVYGFVIHPRAGLPRDIGWMSENYLHYVGTALAEAKRTGMQIILYDEAMYPSGSSGGQVAAENPAHACRGLVMIDLDEATPDSVNQGIRLDTNKKPLLDDNQTLVASVRKKSDNHRVIIVDQPSGAVIRGIHFTEEDPPRQVNHKEVPENNPLAGDLLNPDAMKCFIRLVYQKYYDNFKQYFGETVIGIFTDEPHFLGRGGWPDDYKFVAGTTGVLEVVNRILGYDFTPYLPALFDEGEPDSQKYRQDYNNALASRLEETYYAQISCWCEEHGVALTGHPASAMDIGLERYFHIPGQDVVLRWVEMGNDNALEGPESTQAKNASSQMVHLGRRRNINECCGAFGHNFTFKEYRWIINWLAVRGCNMFSPHAFYYSIRGPRIDERPRDLGRNSPWWNDYKEFADYTGRLAYINTDSRHICDLAILCRSDFLPWKSAKICFENQYDFNYLEERFIFEDAVVTENGIQIRDMEYKHLILETKIDDKTRSKLAPLFKTDRIIEINEEEQQKLLPWLKANVRPGLDITGTAEDNRKNIRVRKVVKNNLEYMILFNEGTESCDIDISGLERGYGLFNDNEGDLTDLPASKLLHLKDTELTIMVKDKNY